MPKRRRAHTDAIDIANGKTDEQFIEEYLCTPGPDASPWISEWSHPQTKELYTLHLLGAENLSNVELQQCFHLISETSERDYRNSSFGWQPKTKRKEMKSSEFRYILVKEAAGRVCAFTSLVPTYEEGQPVVYCYEIHLKPELRGTGLAALLMGFHFTAARALPTVEKVMLTCFLSNRRALNFYRRLGFEKDEISPETRRLRTGDIEPDYVIMSRRVSDPQAAGRPLAKRRNQSEPGETT